MDRSGVEQELRRIHEMAAAIKRDGIVVNTSGEAWAQWQGTVTRADLVPSRPVQQRLLQGRPGSAYGLSP